jgi:glycosyltransferase involved in cell wall biosynthesis
MKIGIYREFTGGGAGLGGAEFSVAALAEGFQDWHDVEVIHDIPAFTRERIEEFFGITLNRTRFRFEPGRPVIIPDLKSRWPWRMYREAAQWSAHLSAPYDLFICLTHYLPPFCHARDGLLIVLFPIFDRFSLWPWNQGTLGRPRGAIPVTREAIWTEIQTLSHTWIWDRRFRSYPHRQAISEFTRRWTKKWWGVDCGVLYPPVEIGARTGEKQPIILSIGRITPEKQHLELVQTFGAMARAGMGGWSLCCTGGIPDRTETLAYLDEVRRAAESLPIRILTNPSRADLESSLGSARIYWHAMGYGKDETVDPFAMEHFGIATVEAMAWGCVPVVINRGGQPEIVRHGVDGFVWNTLGELEQYTRLLMSDDELWAKMSESSRCRAQIFGKQRFVREVASCCGISLNGQ